MKFLLSLLLIALFGAYSFAQENYSRVQINTDSEGLSRLAELGVAIDHGKHKKGHFFISDFSSRDIEIMEANGFDYDILIYDVKQYYRDHSGDLNSLQKNVGCAPSFEFNPPVPVNHYENPGYAGFYKYQDMLDALDDMFTQFPTLITTKTQISSFLTHEGREIFYVKISDTPGVDDPTEPKVLYSSIHHAREPLSLTQTIYYMWYLLENYATNEEVKFLVDNTEMYFIPCLNPDGYIQNESNDPAGFGMHRKNKAPVGFSNPGVDLNRNYSYGWGTTGVDFDPDHDTYPGSGAFSEPETQAMKWMVETYGFEFASNSHTYGDLILYPVGTTETEFADHHDYFDDFASHMAIHNGYVPQKSSGLYPASGDSDDYMYKVDIGVGSKDTVFAITPEVGDGFWPSQAGIVPTCIEMIHPNLVLAHLTHNYHVVTNTDAGSILTMTGDFNHTIQRLGRKNGAVNVSIEPLLNILSVGASVPYSLNLSESSGGAISYVLDPSIVFGDEVRYVINLEYGAWTYRDTVSRYFGSPTLQLTENGTSSANWTGDWGTTTLEYYSAPRSFTDSPSGANYDNDANTSWEFDPAIDLTNATAAKISYRAKWEIEADYDYCQFQVSADGGSSWIGQCGNYTVLGVNTGGWGSGVQPDGEPVYEGYQPSWVLEEINLSDYLGQVIHVRFQLESDGGLRQDGFYFDDFQVSYDIDDSGLDEFAFEVKTIPNPANEEAYISLSKAISNGNLKIYDQSGRIMLDRDISEQTNRLTIETGELPQGVYLVYVEEKGISVRPVKLVVVH